MGGKDGNPPDLATMYFESHKKGDTLATMESSHVHEKIISIQQDDPSLRLIEVAEKVYGESKTKKCISGYGGGVKPRDIRGPYKTKSSLLDELKAKDQALKDKEEALKVQEQALKVAEDEKCATKKRLENVENVLHRIVSNQKFQELLDFSEDDGGYASSPSISENDILN